MEQARAEFRGLDGVNPQDIIPDYVPPETPVGTIEEHVELTVEPSTSYSEEKIAPQPVTARTKAMYSFLKKRFDDGDILNFQDQMKGRSRKTVSISFLEILALKAKSLINLTQEKPYAPIMISKMDLFNQTNF